MRAEVEKRSAVSASRKQRLTRTLGDSQVAGRVPRELCQRAKKTPAVRTWVRSLEEPVRRYLVEQQQQQQRKVAEDADADLKTDCDDDDDVSLDSEDEEIVFVGRNGKMRDGKSKSKMKSNLKGQRQGQGNIENVGGQWKKARRSTKATGATQDEGMLFDGLGDEDGGAFRYVLPFLPSPLSEELLIYYFSHPFFASFHRLPPALEVTLRLGSSPSLFITGAGSPIPFPSTTVYSRAPSSSAIPSARLCMSASNR